MSAMDENWAALQVRRLAGLRGFSLVPEAASELKRVLMLARTRQEAAEVVDEWMELSERTPTPKNLRELLFQKRVAQERIEYLGDPACPECHGSGYRIGAVNGIEGAERCVCKPVKGATTK